MTYFKLILTALQIIQGVMGYLHKRGIIKEEQQRELLRQLELTAAAAGIKRKNKEAAEKLNDTEADAALESDFRD